MMIEGQTQMCMVFAILILRKTGEFETLPLALTSIMFIALIYASTLSVNMPIPFINVLTLFASYEIHCQMKQ
jgi:hypothetical protein